MCTTVLEWGSGFCVVTDKGNENLHSIGLRGCWLPQDLKQIKPNDLSEQDFFAMLSNAHPIKETFIFSLSQHSTEMQMW